MIVIGTGGLSKSIIDSSRKKKIYFIDEFQKIDGKIILNDINEDNYRILKREKIIIAIGSNISRYKWYKKIKKFNLNFTNIIDKTSIISKNAKIGKSNFIGKNAIINSNAIIGNNNIINSGVIIEHSVKIGNHCNISPGSVINGDTSIGDGTWIGSNATIFGQLKIGKNCIIGAGSIIRKDIPDDSVFVGNNKFLKKNDKFDFI